MKDRNVIEALGRILKGTNMSIGVKRGFRNNIVLPPLTYGSEVWLWNTAQLSSLYLFCHSPAYIPLKFSD